MDYRDIGWVEPKQPPAVPPINRVFLVREQNDRGVEGRGPYLPKVIFDNAKDAVEYVCELCRISVEEAPKEDADGGYHFSQGFSIDPMPVLSSAIIEKQAEIGKEFKRVEKELKELSAYAAALKAAKIYDHVDD